MTEVVIYTGLLCSFCDRARALLKSKKIDFEEINVALNPAQRAVMIERAGGAKTVPQVFIDDMHVGGCDELHALDRSGKLDEMLFGETA